MQDIREQVEHFYEWESLGRGDLIWNDPVRIEPPFTPFRRKFSSTQHQPIDDGRVEPTFRKLIKKVVETLSSHQQAESTDNAQTDDENKPVILPPLDESDDEKVEIQVLLPESTSVTPALAEQFLISLDQCHQAIAFEIIGRQNSILIQFTVHSEDAGFVQSQLEAHFPTSTILSIEPCVLKSWHEGKPSLILEMGLTKEFMLPLRETSSYAQDPIISIARAMASLADGEISILQVIFEPLRQPWRSNIERAITREDGSPFFDDDRDFTSACYRKIQRPLYAVICRIGVQAEKYNRVIQLATNLSSALSIFNHPSGNELLPLENDAYDLDDHLVDLLQRKTRRSGMIWNSAELISLVHPPNNSVQIPKLLREGGKTKRAPSITIGHSTILGDNTHASVTQEVTLSTEHRLRHTHIIGTSGSGKSTLLFNLMMQDILNGKGFALLDPAGDLADQILRIIPEERINDVILFDPSDEAFPIGLNILDAHSELEKNLLASDLVSVFKRLSSAWGDQMSTVFENVILAILESSRGGTLQDLRRFLVEPDFRNEFLRTVEDPQLVYYWKKEFPMLSGRPQAPILTRLNKFLMRKGIRNMVSQKKNKLNFAEIMDSGKIFLAKLSQGALGVENSYLLGTLLVSKFYQIAMSRQATEAQARRPFWLYVDEFHNYVSSSMASILTEARKYGLGLTLAHQEMKQIESRDADVAGSVIANPYTRICFRLGDEDARKLGKGFSFFEEKDLQNLAAGEAICRVEKSEYDFNLKVSLPDSKPGNDGDSPDQIRKQTREKYATPRNEVEALLRKEQPDLFDEEPPTPKTTKPKTPPPHSESESPQPEQRKSEAPNPETSDQKPAESKPGVDPLKKEPNQEDVPQEPVKSTPKEDTPPLSHEEIKEYLITEAKKLDFTIKREVLVLGGSGRIDLVFTRGKLKIACEIACTTSDEHEFKNITKCIRAGFKQITVVSIFPNRLKNIAKLFREQVSDPAPDVDFRSPEAFVEILKRFAKSDPTAGKEERSKQKPQPFKFKDTDMTEEERKEMEQKMLNEIQDAMKKNKPNNP